MSSSAAAASNPESGPKRCGQLGRHASPAACIQIVGLIARAAMGQHCLIAGPELALLHPGPIARRTAPQGAIHLCRPGCRTVRCHVRPAPPAPHVRGSLPCLRSPANEFGPHRIPDQRGRGTRVRLLHDLNTVAQGRRRIAPCGHRTLAGPGGFARPCTMAAASSSEIELPQRPPRRCAHGANRLTGWQSCFTRSADAQFPQT